MATASLLSQMVRGVCIAVYVLALLACAAQFAFGLVLCAAAYQPGTRIRFYEPVDLAMLVEEFAITPLSAAISPFNVVLGAWFSLLLVLALLLLFAPRPIAGTFVGRILLVSCFVCTALPGSFGLYGFYWTLINAFFLGGLDGETVDEGWLFFDAFGLLFLLFALVAAYRLYRYRDWAPNNSL